MKKVFLAMAMMLVSVAGFSQLRLDARLGMSMTNYTKSDGLDMKVGYLAGIGLDYAFNDMWSFQSGVMFTGKGAKVSTTADDIDVTVKIKPNYMDIPLMAALKLPVADDVKFVINAGPYMGIGLGGKYTAKGSDGSMALTESKKMFSDDSSNIIAFSKAKRFDLGLQYGVGAELGDHYLLNLNGQYGFISPWDNSDSKNLAFYLTVGYRF